MSMKQPGFDPNPTVSAAGDKGVIGRRRSSFSNFSPDTSLRGR